MYRLLRTIIIGSLLTILGYTGQYLYSIDYWCLWWIIMLSYLIGSIDGKIEREISK